MCIRDRIEGASEGVGLGLEFLRHIERTRVMIHVVDAAGTEGRDPIADIKAIDKELAAYDPELLKKPQVIAANKIDSIYGDENEIIKALKDEFEKDGIKAVSYTHLRGDRKIGQALLKVYEKGGIFDAWSEYFDYQRWEDAFAECGIDTDLDRKSTRLNSSHLKLSRMPSSA